MIFKKRSYRYEFECIKDLKDFSSKLELFSVEEHDFRLNGFGVLKGVRVSRKTKEGDGSSYGLPITYYFNLEDDSSRMDVFAPQQMITGIRFHRPSYYDAKTWSKIVNTREADRVNVAFKTFSEEPYRLLALENLILEK